MSDEPEQGFLEWEDENPLLKEIPLTHTVISMSLALSHDPRVLYEMESPAHSRIPRLIGKLRHLFVATKVITEFCVQFMEVLIQGLEDRDPRLEQCRARPYETGRFKGMEVSKLPWFSDSAAGMVLEGITGSAKTHTIKRLLRFLPQVVTHGASAEYGWQELKQLVYLVVPMPASARLGAFLLQVAVQLDKALGKEYEKALRSKDLSDDKRAVLLLHWLSLHRCGMLIVEECQERNIKAAEFGSDFLMLFLRTMNWGIPVCLVANPKALASVETFTQDGRRFGSGHWFTFEPVWDYRSNLWTKDLVPKIWGWSPLGEADPPLPNKEQYLWQKTGGVIAFLSTLRKESLKQAYRQGRNHVIRDDIETASKGRAMKANLRLIDALVTFDPGKLAALTDIPADRIIARWIELGLAEVLGQEGVAGEPGSAVPTECPPQANSADSQDPSSGSNRDAGGESSPSPSKPGRTKNARSSKRPATVGDDRLGESNDTPLGLAPALPPDLPRAPLGTEATTAPSNPAPPAASSPESEKTPAFGAEAEDAPSGSGNHAKNGKQPDAPQQKKRSDFRALLAAQPRKPTEPGS